MFCLSILIYTWLVKNIFLLNSVVAGTGGTESLLIYSRACLTMGLRMSRGFCTSRVGVRQILSSFLLFAVTKFFLMFNHSSFIFQLHSNHFCSFFLWNVFSTRPWLTAQYNTSTHTHIDYTDIDAFVNAVSS